MLETIRYEVFVGPTEIVLATPSSEGGFAIVRPVRAGNPDDGFLEAWMSADDFGKHYRKLSDGEKALLGF